MEHCHQTGAAGTSYLSELKKLMSRAQKERRIKYDDNPFNFAIDIPPVPTHLLRTKVEAPSMDEILTVYAYDWFSYLRKKHTYREAADFMLLIYTGQGMEPIYFFLDFGNSVIFFLQFSSPN